MVPNPGDNTISDRPDYVWPLREEWLFTSKLAVLALPLLVWTLEVFDAIGAEVP